MTVRPERFASRITYQPAQIDVEPNGSPCASTIRGRSVTRSSSENEIQCGSASVRSTTASAYGRSSNPGTSKYAVNVRWRDPTATAFSASVRSRWSTQTAMAEESIPPESAVPSGTSLRRRRRTESRKSSRTASAGSPCGGGGGARGPQRPGGKPSPAQEREGGGGG